MPDTVFLIAFPQTNAQDAWSIARVSMPPDQVRSVLETLVPWQVSYYPAADEPGVVSLGHYAPGWLEALGARASSVEILDHDAYDASGRVGSTTAFGDDISFAPGLAFGDFRHPSTRLCMAGIDQLVQASKVRSLADIGCGTGVLALVASRRGVPRVVAHDIDPYACFIARRNAARNELRIEISSDFPQGEFDLVVANIWLSAFPELADALTRALAPGGTLLLAGFRSEHASEVEACFPELALNGTLDESGFSRLSLSRR